jgi:hypothetical protein
LKIILATLLKYRDHAVALESCNHIDRLLSYYMQRNYPDESLQVYVTTGFPPKRIVKSKNTWKSTLYIRNRRIALANRLINYECEN